MSDFRQQTRKLLFNSISCETHFVGRLVYVKLLLLMLTDTLALVTCFEVIENHMSKFAD